MFPIDIKHRPIEVLSLFDGYAGGLQALKEAGYKVKKYHAFEIDKHAIKIAMKNHPEIIQHGSVIGANFRKFKNIDLLLGGSPCQGFSFVGKQLAFNDPRSVLFFEYVRAKKQTKPQFFLLENVRMASLYQDIISDYLGVEYIQINSALLSAQNRIRNYWCNWEVKQPKDMKIYLADILETKLPATGARIVGRRLNSNGNREDKNKVIPVKQYIEKRSDKKANCMTTAFKDSVIAFSLSQNELRYMKRKTKDGRSHWDFQHHSDSDKKKSSCVVANFCKGVPYNVLIDRTGKEILYRKFTPVECERLQTLPDNYTGGASNSQAYKMLGNGFHIKTITHILNSEDL